MSSAVPSFLSGPGEETITSSSVQEILYGLFQASSVLDALSISLSWTSCETLGQSPPPRMPRQRDTALRISRAFWSVVLTAASFILGSTATTTPAEIMLRMATTMRTSMRVTPRARRRRARRGDRAEVFLDIIMRATCVQRVAFR